MLWYVFCVDLFYSFLIFIGFGYEVSFFQALSVNCKLVLPMHCPQLWAQISGIEGNDARVMPFEKTVPLILKDVSAILLQFLCALPFNIDKGETVNCPGCLEY